MKAAEINDAWEITIFDDYVKTWQSHRPITFAKPKTFLNIVDR